MYPHRGCFLICRESGRASVGSSAGDEVKVHVLEESLFEMRMDRTDVRIGKSVLVDAESIEFRPCTCDWNIDCANFRV